MNLDCSGPRPRLLLQDPQLRLTQAQQQALAIDRELVVTAGAGAGKTFALSLRYLSLLLELSAQAVTANPTHPHPDIEAVLVLTFTEKAAVEMAERCYRRLLSLAESIRSDGPSNQALRQAYGQKYPLQLGAAIDHLVDHFDRARIGTFHGFCARLLTEYPQPTQTAPGFTVLDEAETKALVWACIDGELGRVYGEGHPELTALIAAFGNHRGLREALESALSQRDLLGPILRAHRGRGIGIDDLFALFPISPAEQRDWLATTGRPLLHQVVMLARPGGGGRHLVEVVEPALSAVTALLDLNDPGPLEVAAVYRQVLGSLCGASGKLRSLKHHSFMGSVKTWARAAYDEAKAALNDLADHLQDWPSRLAMAAGLPTAVDSAMLKVLPLFSELALNAMERLDTAFAEAGAVDFTALQERAVNAVLTHDDLRKELCRRHRYLMVDEFQDTDERQWAMVRALGRPRDQAEDRIFVVGDAKQAIYRFRGGDVTVFRSATEELGVEPIVFAENFRSTDALIDFFNVFFGECLGRPSPDRPAYEAGYTPLKAGRGAPGGTVSLALYESTKDAATDAQTEAMAVARCIAGVFLSPGGPHADLQLGDRALHPSPPIAILLRSRTRLAEFEAALRQAHIPFIVTKGVGFWAKPEVVDVINLLHAVATHDPISVVGCLRSPLLGLSDVDLAHLHASEGVDFATLLDGPLPGHLGPHIHRAHAILVELRSQRHLRSVPDLLHRLVEITYAEHAFALLDDQGQASANVQRLIEIASDQAHRGLTAFVRNALSQIQGDTRDSEAPIPPSRARVVLMTVHASKGLEFPVVVVPECGKRPRTRSRPLEYGRLGTAWHVASRALDPESAVRTRARSGLLDLLSWVDGQESQAESRRLLYVAATRARDHLVLLGTAPKDGVAQADAKTWSEMLGAAIDLERPPPGLNLVDLQTWLDLDPAAIAAPQPLPAPTDTSARTLAPIETQTHLDVSPSSLDRFADDPRGWYRRDRLGVRESGPTGATQGHAIALAGARGEVIHSLLEDDVAEDVETAQARWRARATLAGGDAQAIEAGWPILQAHLARTIADPRVQDRLDAPGMAEVRFRLAHAGVVLVGQIDRLWRDPEGHWVVLDWESEQIQDDAQTAAQRHARQLLAYAWAADRVLHARGAGRVHRAEVYFTQTAELVAFPPFSSADYESFEADLAEVARVAALSWDQVQTEFPPPTA